MDTTNLANASSVSGRLRNLSPAKQRAFDTLLQQKRESQTIPRRQNQSSLPLSFAQERLWFLHHVAPALPLFNMSGGIRMGFAVDYSLVERALRKLVQRHLLLRSRFPLVHGIPQQTVLSEEEVVLIRKLSLSACSEADRELRLEGILKEEAARPFDLQVGPLFRASMLHLDDTDHLLQVTMHHIISDGASVKLLTHEFIEMYEALSTGRSICLGDIELEYPDFATWQHSLFAEGRLSPEIDRCVALLREGGAASLPKSYPNIEVDWGNTELHKFSVSGTLTERLRALAQREHTTLFAVLLSTLQIVLYRHTLDSRSIIAVPISGRNWPETEPVVGCFINTVLVVGTITSDSTFVESLRQTTARLIEAQANGKAPFEKVCERLRKDGVPIEGMVRTMFQLREIGRESSGSSGQDYERLTIDSGAGGLDLAIIAVGADEQLDIEVKFQQCLYHRSKIEYLSRQWGAAMEAVTAEPLIRVSEISICDDGEKDTIERWNRTECQYDFEGWIHDVFAKRASERPDSIALSFEDSNLTYGALNRTSDLLAARLLELDVRPESTVGVCLERSLELVISLIAILKAGGSYLPLDPSYPQGRLASMLSDPRVNLVLTSSRVNRSLPTAGTVLDIEQVIRTTSLDVPATRISPSISNNSAAYVIYTSGSTGVPKGALNTHGGILNRLQWMQQQYKLTKEDCVLQKTPFSFDVSVWEFFWPLMVGAKLVLAHPGGHRDHRYLTNLIQREYVTTIHFVPSMLQLFLDGPDLDRCSSLKRVICSGEALSSDLKDRFFQRFSCELHNLYGPTEAAVDVTFYECHKVEAYRSVPIGRPIANTQIRILDPRLRPVPIEAPGEIHIGGVGLARGYVNRPELTAEKFLPDPSSTRFGGRMYRTGDLGRFRSDGAIEYLGRIDQQVKIRGFRIELGEIEVALLSMPPIREAVAIVQMEGEPSIAAYIVPRDSERLSLADVRSELKRILPDYMLPRDLVVLSAIPLSPNGKVDRARLPTPSRTRSQSPAEFVPPETEIESRLAEIWKQLLGVDRIGIHDSFFDLGGHSLLMIQLASRIEEQLGVRVSLRTLFDAPTISLLIAKLLEQQLDVADPELVTALLQEIEPVSG